MAFFWHGHITTSINKAGSADAMQDQIDLFRRRGLGAAGGSGNVATVVVEASMQPAMVRYLDNRKNFAESPNQNFARELMELFLLGVGNYTEADVEAATAAWTGHTNASSDIYTYLFDAARHEASPQQFLGRMINATRPPQEAGAETIEVILGTGPLGSGMIPTGAEQNAGRPSKEVAAEFLTFKLWQEFAEATTGSVPGSVRSAMVAALLDNDFDIRPWVRAMLVHDEFYTGAARSGLVRQPVEYMVALLVATGLDATVDNIPNWLLSRVGQQLLYPPDVSGWKPNGYWVNVSSMATRKNLVDHAIAKLQEATWGGVDGYLQFGPTASTRITKTEIEGRGPIQPIPTTALVDRFASYAGITITPATRRTILRHLDDDAVEGAMRLDALTLMLSAPDMHIA